jgi:hypothetical protein
MRITQGKSGEINIPLDPGSAGGNVVPGIEAVER